jgi:hypothetical protein
MTFMSWANAILGMVLVAVSIYSMIYGRRIFRWVIFWNGVAGAILFIAYAIVIYDRQFSDILTWQQTTEYLIKPTIFILGFVLLLNMLLLGLGNRNDA